MLRLAALVLAVAVASPAAAAAPSSLRIRVWPDGASGSSSVWTLRCNPVGGTVPMRAAACRALTAARAPFAPVPKDVVCTQIYGGPQVALVTGTFRGRRVWARFQRRDGCEIARWDRLRVLFSVPSG